MADACVLNPLICASPMYNEDRFYPMDRLQLHCCCPRVTRMAVTRVTQVEWICSELLVRISFLVPTDVFHVWLLVLKAARQVRMVVLCWDWWCCSGWCWYCCSCCSCCSCCYCYCCCCYYYHYCYYYYYCCCCYYHHYHHHCHHHYCNNSLLCRRPSEHIRMRCVHRQRLSRHPKHPTMHMPLAILEHPRHDICVDVDSKLRWLLELLERSNFANLFSMQWRLSMLCTHLD